MNYKRLITFVVVSLLLYFFVPWELASTWGFVRYIKGSFADNTTKPFLSLFIILLPFLISAVVLYLAKIGGAPIDQKLKAYFAKPKEERNAAMEGLVALLVLVGIFLFIHISGTFSKKYLWNKIEYLPENTYCDPIRSSKVDSKYKMSLVEALEIIEDSECSNYGNALKTGFCNAVSNTWWIDMHVDDIGDECIPACVVDLVSKTAHYDARCP